MKKYISLVLISIFSFIGCLKVNASDTYVSPGKTINYKYNDIENFGDYKLIFETDYLEITDRSDCIDSNNVLLKGTCSGIKFKVKDYELTENKSSYISIVKQADENDRRTRTKIVLAATKEETTTKKEEETTTNQNNEEQTTKVEESTTKEEETTTVSETTTTAAPLSTNAYLSELEINGSDGNAIELTPKFAKDVYEYNAEIPSAVSTISINAFMEDSKANMIISDNADDELIAGENNKITITVTAEDGTKKAYVVNIKRGALTSDATLRLLKIFDYEKFEFKYDKFNYDVIINKEVKELKIAYEASSDKATVEVFGNENLENGSKVKLLVTAEDGTKKEYILNIKHEEEKKGILNNIKVEKSPVIIVILSLIGFTLIGAIIFVIKNKD